MKVVKTKKIGDCLEGTNVHDLLLDGVATSEFIHYLGKMGKLIYNTSMDKPFYKVIVRAKYTLKGSESNSTIRVMLPDSAGDKEIEEISQFIGKYESS